MALTPERRQELGRSLRLLQRGILAVDEVATRLGKLAYPDSLEAVLAEVPPDLVEPLMARFSENKDEFDGLRDSWVARLAKLPPVTGVEAVSLGGINPNRVSLYMQEARDLPGVALAGEAARLVVALLGQLPRGDQARCHIPPYGLRFFSEENLILQASICWKCNNIFGESLGEKFSQEFDAAADVSTQLFDTIRQAVGDEPDT